MALLCGIPQVGVGQTPPPCALPGGVHAAVGSGTANTVTGSMSFFYANSGDRPGTDPPRIAVALIPISGTDAPARHADVQGNNEFDFGQVHPGRYFVRAEFPDRPPLLGEIEVSRTPVRLCLGAPVKSQPLFPHMMGCERGCGMAPSGVAVSARDLVAIGDAIGRYRGSMMAPSAEPFGVAGFGLDDAVLKAARRGFLMARGDNPLPSADTTGARRVVLIIGSINVLSADSVTATTSIRACFPSTAGFGMEDDMQGHVLVRGSDPSTWMVTLSPRGMHGSGTCR